MTKAVVIITKRGEHLEIIVVMDRVEILKRPVSWDLNQVKELL